MLTNSTCINGGRGIRFETIEDELILSNGILSIRKAIDGQGHIPFLTNVYSVYFIRLNDPLCLLL